MRTKACKTLLATCGALLFTPTLTQAQTADTAKKTKKPAKKTQSERAGALSPAEQLQKFTVPEGFVVELVASEQNGLINPVDLAFDTAGRLWTGTSQMYPIDPKGGRKNAKPQEIQRIIDLYQRTTKGQDKVLRIDDPTKKVEGQIPVFADGMTIPQSYLPYQDGVFVAHGSEMLFLRDEDGDGKEDSCETVLTGFGISDTHTLAHTLVRGPGGWIHFSHGALNQGMVTATKSGEQCKINYSKIARFSLDGEKIEITNNGLNNIWGFALKGNGQWYGTEANDWGLSHVPLHQYMGHKGIGGDRLRSYQPFGSDFHEFRVEGTGISGLAYDENGSKGFPAEYQNVGFLANPITNTINLVVADRRNDGSVISQHLPDFLSCDDDWFRPVNIEFGPDGCLYIVDWYNKIVSHNEVKRDHPDRDKSHGRLWRVRHKSQVPRTIPNIAQAPNTDLLTHLQAEILWEKRSAWTEVVDRQATELIPQLVKLAGDTSAALTTRIHALWSLEGLGHYDFALIQSLTQSPEPDLRREALRSLVSFQPSIEELVTLAQPLANDPHFMVKEELLRTLKNIGVANADTIKTLVSFAAPQSKENSIKYGPAFTNSFQSFLAFMALEEYPTELAAFLDSPEAQTLPVANLNEAAKRLPKGARGQKIIEAVQKGTTELDANTLVALAPSLKDPKVIKALQTHLEKKEFVHTAVEALPGLRATDLHRALLPALDQLLASSEAADQQLALQALVAYQHPGLGTQVVSLVGQKAPADLTPLDLQALALSPDASLLTGLIHSPTASTGIRAKAALALVSSDASGAYQALDGLLQQDDTRAGILSALKANAHGMTYLIDALSRQIITPAELSLVEKTQFLSALGKSARSFQKEVTTAAKETAQSEAKLIHATAQAYAEKGGDAATGKLLSGSCIACHQIGNTGVNLAPSLGGYKDRDPEHLLTAIISPNAAIEKGYELYRIIQKDGTITEGFLHNKGNFGTTIANAGGGQTYLPKERIQSEGFVSGQSNMPTFGGLPEEHLRNLIAYLKTL